MASKKYLLPGFLIGRCTADDYLKWLSGRAVSHVRRDRKRGHTEARREAYMIAINAAVLRSGGVDDYTGENLAWESINTYDNAKSQEGRRLYKKSLGMMPTVDHFGDDLTADEFRICSWRTNDCKNDLSDEELVDFCRTVLAYDKKRARAKLKEAKQKR
ncbi:MAG TPA: hypothetical protein VLL54_14315 [Pyrinomonadaceae bacterium]|nr:hypothetical protein [Pyrinomonadaceae bacterium]